MHRSRTTRHLLTTLALVLAVVWAFPVYWMLNSAFLPNTVLQSATPTFLPFGGSLDNLTTVVTEPSFRSALAMSLVVTLTTVVAAILVASAVYAFLQAWNEFTVALVVMTEEQSRTLPLWLRGFVQASASRETDWGQVMAASTLVAVPVIIFFLIVQGRMSSGLVGGAVKG